MSDDPSASFLGATRSLRRCDAVLSEVVHARARSVDEHVHALAYFCLLLDGRYRETSGDVWLDYRTYTLAFHPPMTSHRDEMGDGTRFFMIELEERWIDTVRSVGVPIRELRKIHGEDAIWLAVRLHQEYARGDDASDLTIEALLYELCGWAAEEAVRAEPHAPPWLAAVDARLEREPDRKLELRTLAADAGIHPTHLARTFRRVHGRSIGDYVTGLRVQCVCTALAETGATLAEIAADAGFVDQSHLTRVFRRALGTTPGAYRSAARAGSLAARTPAP